MRPASGLVLLLALLALTGCGRERVRTPAAMGPAPAGAPLTADYPEVGVKFEAPESWGVTQGKGTLIATTRSSSATVAVWRYVRTEPLPREPDALEAAKTQLLQAVRARDPRFREDSVEVVKVDGAPALQILGTGTIEGNPRRVRSTHVYAKGAELVVDAYAAPDEFAVADREVFLPLLRSLKIDPPQA